jgi:hypothetical protein
MSVCSPCYDSGIILDQCASGITFGVVEPETSYQVNIKHNATGRIQSFPVSSDESGMITISGVKMDALQGYTISLQGCDDTFTICEQQYTCISFSVVNSNIDPGDTGVINLIDCEC